MRHHLIGSVTEVEAGVPVDDPALATDRMTPGVLPAGRYVVAHHLGHPGGLPDVQAARGAGQPPRDWSGT